MTASLRTVVIDDVDLDADQELSVLRGSIGTLINQILVQHELLHPGPLAMCRNPICRVVDDDPGFLPWIDNPTREPDET